MYRQILMLDFFSFFFFFWKRFTNLIQSAISPFSFSSYDTYERWFSRDKKKCSAFSHDIQRLVSDQARCKRSVFKLFIRIDTGQSLRTNASCDLARREERKKKKKGKKRKVFQRHEISWSLTSFHVIRYTSFDVVRALMIPTTDWISIMIRLNL